MDKTARDVLEVLLERLRQLEINRIEDFAALTALITTVRRASQTTDAQFRLEFEDAKARSLDRLARVNAAYDGLIRALKDPGPPEEDEQEKLRRLLESFEGPEQ